MKNETAATMTHCYCSTNNPFLLIVKDIETEGTDCPCVARYRLVKLSLIVTLHKGAGQQIQATRQLIFPMVTG